MKKNNDNIQNKILETYRTEVKINFPDYINNNNNTDKPKHKYYAVMHFDTELNLNISSQPNVWLNYKNQFFEEKFGAVDLSATFSAIEEESGIRLHGILGSKFFEKYKYILDFKELTAYR